MVKSAHRGSKAANTPGEVFRLSVDGRLRRLAALSALGICSLVPMGAAYGAGATPVFGTPAWFAQKVAQQPVNPSAPSAGVPSAITTPGQAKTQAKQSMTDLNNALAAILAAQTAQGAARQLSIGNANSVPDGLNAGGLVPDSGLKAPGVANTPTDWIGLAANGIQQATGANNQVTVTVTQDQSKAIYTWNSFNVGKNTTLDFDQHLGTQTDGSNNWVALNRVMGGNGAAQILGTIKAQGDVYIIDQNGIMFGATSQVNTHSLIASSLDLLSADTTTSNNLFLSGGISAGITTSNNTVPGLLVAATVAGPGGKPTPAAGNITIEAGASITTGEQGFSLIAAPQITNAGTITANDGQIILAAGQGVGLTNAANSLGLLSPVLVGYDPDLPQGKLINTGIIQADRGNVTLLGLDIQQDGIVGASTSVTRPGSITIDAGVPGIGLEGAVTFEGGIAGAGPVTIILPSEDGETTTSSPSAITTFTNSGLPQVNISGGSVVFQPGSLLEAPGATVNITASTDGGNYVPPSEQNLIAQAGRVFVDSGATIDVAGMANVQLPANDTMVTISKLTANDLADSPLLRDGFLIGQTVVVDSTQAGTRADGTPWEGSPIIDATGYIQAVPQTIDQLLVNGGKINLTGNEVIAKTGSVLNLDGGYINYQGGMVSGPTELLGSDGQIYSIGNANPDITYVGFAGQFSTDHARWNQTDTWIDPLLSGSVSQYEPGFIQGGNAGQLNVVVNAIQPTGGQGTAILDGTILAHAMAGRNQVTSGSQPLGGVFSIGVTGGDGPYGPSYFITDQNLNLPGPSQNLPDGFTATTSLQSAFPGLTGSAISPTTRPTDSGSVPAGGDPANPNTDTYNLQYWTPINGAALAGAGFSSINITAQQGQILVPAGASLIATPGTSTSKNQYGIFLNAAQVTLGGSVIAPDGQVVTPGAQLIAHGGDIDITTVGLTLGPTFLSQNTVVPTAPPQPGNITVGSGAVVDVSGQWVNDTGLSPDQISGSEFINGGKINFSTVESSATVQNSSGNGTYYADTTGGIYVDGTLNVSSGGYVQPDGQLLMNGNVPQGAAGSIKLIAYETDGDYYGSSRGTYPNPPSQQPVAGLVDISQGLLLGYGLASGGSLAIEAPGFYIGSGSSKPSAAAAWDSYIQAGPNGFFSGRGNAKGFGSYELDAEYDATIAPGTTVVVTQQNLLPNYNALVSAPTGYGVLVDNSGAVSSQGLVTVGTLDPYHRQPTNLTITAGDYYHFNVGILGDALTGSTPDYSANGVSGTLLLGKGASIVADAGANILLGSANAVDIEGSITAHGGNITLDGQSGITLQQSFANSTPSQSVTLGSAAVLDVSGVALVDPYVQPVQIGGTTALPTTGKVLDGGTVSIYSANVTAQQGSTINVSGAGGAGSQAIIFDVPQANGSYAPQQEWSNAGSIILGAGQSLNFAGTIAAQAGSGVLADGSVGQGQGGSLSIYALDTASAVILSSGGASGTAAGGTLLFNVDSLKNSGVSSLNIGSDTKPDGTAPETVALAPITLGFAGNIDLNLGLSFIADASNYVALPEGATSVLSPATASTVVDITAPYVALNGYYNTSVGGGLSSPLAGLSVLNVNASDFIDLGGAFTVGNFNIVNFNSGGDIRFVTPENFEFVPKSSTPQRGVLYTAAAQLNFTARELYAATNNSFVIEDSPPGTPAPFAGTITISQATDGNGTPIVPVVPLAAGGSLLFDAANINQNGVIWNPAGSVVLGVGNIKDSSTVALFNPTDPALGTTVNSLPLVNTLAVELGAGSKTSVSLDNTVIPYGTTLDGKEWQYNESQLGNTTRPDLTAPPAKLIQIEGASVALNQGAAVDLSGGGQLQAIEWVPGTGGTRDVLSQYNTSYAVSTSGTQVPLYPDGRGIYALVPSYEAPVAAYDAVFSQGQASIALGESVYLSGSTGIPAGNYVLMPAKYATLPGALRIVQDTGTIDSLASQNSIAPDGTAFIAGYFDNALDGSRSSRSTTFEVQTAAVWGQYSDYTRTPADTFFSNLAAQSGGVTPQLPQDAGQLILGASSALSLGASLNTAAAASGGAQAEIDIASQNIAIVAQQGQAEAGATLELTVADLNALQAGSLLIGGTRSQTSSGVSINALATSLVVDDQAASTSNGQIISSQNVLSGPEVILVTKAGGSGLVVDSGSVIAASGAGQAGAGKPITVNGNGSLLMVSNNQPVALNRVADNSGNGILDVLANATITGGNSLILDSSGQTLVDPAAVLSGTNITADGGSIIFVTGGAPAGANGLIIGASTLNQFAGATNISLRSYGDIDFEDTQGAGQGITVSSKGNLSLSAGGFTDGAYGSAVGVSLNATAGTLTLSNDLDPTAKAPTGRALGPADPTLQLNGKEIDFGTAGSGSKNVAWFSGFQNVTATASGGIVGWSNSFDFGPMPVTLVAPVILAGTNSNAALSTTGALILSSASGTALSGSNDLGGQLSLSGGSITDTANLQAAGGNLILDASSGDLHIENGAVLNVAGVGKQFYDVYEYAPGGTIQLTADAGNVLADAGSILNFSGAQPEAGTQGGSNAGGLIVGAPKQSATIAGTITGGAPGGFTGGSFSLDVASLGQGANGASFLGGLAAVLQQSGVNNQIAIRTGSGDLELPGTSGGAVGNTLTANSVILVADAGTVKIDSGATVNANGSCATCVDGNGNSTQGAGGAIELYGTQGVDVEGTLTASTANLSQRGGTVEIGTSGTPNGTLNSQYGYENVDPGNSGTITVGSGAVLNVSGGQAGGHSGGVIDLRAPLLSNGDVNLQVANGAKINAAMIGDSTGATGSVSLEAYAVWSTTDKQSDPNKYFDGIIDPAGWYTSSGQLVPGVFTDQNGTVVNSTDLSQYFFTPTSPNTNHQAFYTATLAGFVQNLGGNSALQNRVAAIAASGIKLSVDPGIELDNPTSSSDPKTVVNGGNITVASNWNLGACNPCAGANPGYLYRYQGQAPILTIRAANNLLINASISDGFSQLVAGPNLTYSAAAYQGAENQFTTHSTLLTAYGNGTIIVNGVQYQISADPDFQPLSSPLDLRSATYYTAYTNYLLSGVNTWAALANKLKNTTYTVSPMTMAKAPDSDAYPSYALYAAAYAGYLKTLTTSSGTPQPPAMLADPKQYSAYLTLWQQYETTLVSLDGIKFGNPAKVSFYIYPPLPPNAGPAVAAVAEVGNFAGDGNSAANVPTLQNVAPLAFATLAGGNSSSYRLVAGAEFSSADPLAVLPLSDSSLASSSPSGSVIIGGHTSAANELLTFTGASSSTVNGTSALLEFPTVVRTGTGSIDVAAAHDLDLTDTTAPGVIYTAGVPAAGTTQNVSVTLSTPGNGGTGQVNLNGGTVGPELVVTGAVNPDDAGDISIQVQRDINGIENVVDQTGSITGQANQFIGQFWTAWMESGNTLQNVNGASTMVASSINFGAFDQGVLSAGGNVAVNAGGNISNLAVSLPTTWYLSSNNAEVHTVGGGNLHVSAGGDIISGDYFVAQGQGVINAGGQIGVDPSYGVTVNLAEGGTQTSSVGTLLALQDANLQVNARQGANIGGVYDPSYLQYGNATLDSKGYDPTSLLSVTSTAGDVLFDTFSVAGTLFSTPPTGSSGFNYGSGYMVLPATLNLTALGGGISLEGPGILSPDQYGQLNLIADQSINFFNADLGPGGSDGFGMIDASPSSMPSPLTPLSGNNIIPYNPTAQSTFSNSASYQDHQQPSPLHSYDLTPARIYSLEGSIEDGRLTSSGFYLDSMLIAPDKVARIYAGQDIVDLNFLGQNLDDSDVTRIVAGRDIYDTPLVGEANLNALQGHSSTVPSLQLAGPGTFDVEAGRNIGPLANQNEAVAQGYNSFGGTGIDTVGNLYNPYLPHQSASVSVLFGAAPGIDTADFIARYIAPGASVNGVPGFTEQLVSFVEQYEEGLTPDTGLLKDQKNITLTPGQAWTAFQALPVYQQQLFVNQVFSSILALTGQDYNNAASPYYHQYARGYDAINTLFPSSYGYTANSLNGGTNGSNAPKSTGDLDVRGSTIQTQQGGDITIFGPGGQILLASASAPPFITAADGTVLAGPNTEGLLTLQQGNINIFTDQSVLLAQSRIFTEQGGSVLIWSSNGDINAGEGTKTTAFVPPLSYICDLNNYCIVNPAGEVTGAGIATLQTVPGAAAGDVELVAPRGTVDAGAAGIRVSGNLVIAALAVANAFNIEVKGNSVGVPTAVHVDTGALTAAGSASAAAEQASALTNRNNNDAGSQITVEVMGFGTPDEEQKKRMRKQSKDGAT